MLLPGIEQKVAFLSRPEAYPDHVQRVDRKQTHMSWVFLTDTYAWKLKKPVRSEYLDFSTPAARKHNCESEVRLNRRLASDVYRGVVPLTVDEQGNLQLYGSGEIVDWLVCMRRLPSDRMLDQLIARQAVSEEDVLKLATLLAAFYKKAQRVRLTGLHYRRRLFTDLEAVRDELTKTDYGLNADLVHWVFNRESRFLQENPAMFDGRAKDGRIIEAHGDLRPEHICLEPQPVIIDCLEFNRDLRILDAASELAFLALECERLGAPWIGDLIFRKYGPETGDHPSDRLLAFYKSYHACIRAKVAIWHLKDEGIQDRAHWRVKANRYLEIASGFLEAGEPALSQTAKPRANSSLADRRRIERQ